MEDKSIESLKQEFIQEIMSEQSFDTLKEWLYMHDEARYVASLTSKEPELIEYNKEFEKSLRKKNLRGQELIQLLSVNRSSCLP